MKEINFFVPGIPKAQGRARAFKMGNRIGFYDPKKSKDWKNQIRFFANEHYKGDPLECALFMELSFLLPRPKSLPKKISDHIKKPDNSNLLKGVEDALKGIIYRDDSQIVEHLISKRYATGKTGVVIRLFDPSTVDVVIVRK